MKIEIVSLFVAVINFILALSVYLKNRENPINQSFGVFSFIVGLWSLSLYFYSHPILFSALTWIRIVYLIGVFPMGFSLLNFSYIFPEGKRLPSKILAFWIMISAPFMFLLLFTNLWVEKVISKPWGYETITGSAYIPVGVYSGFMIGWVVYELISKYRSSKGIQKLQLEYVLWGIILYCITVASIDVAVPLLFHTSRFFGISPISSLFLIGFTTFAITRYHLFDIKIILTEILVGAMGLILTLQVLLTDGAYTKAVGFGVLLLFAIVGYLLIRTTYQEVRRREEVEHLAADLEKANVQIQSVEKMKSDLINMASHEFRTPVGIIKNSLWFLNKNEVTKKIPEKGKVNLERLNQATERLDTLLQNMGEVMAASSGELKLEFAPTQLEILINAVVEAKKTEAAEKRVEIRFQESKEPLPQIEADPTKLKYVFWELLGNALKYTPDGGQITLSAQKENATIRISIADTGAGIPKEKLLDLFQRPFTKGDFFHTTQPGMGLGLFVAKNIVGLHHGQIDIESAEGKGTTVVITLPIKNHFASLSQPLKEEAYHSQEGLVS